MRGFVAQKHAFYLARACLLPPKSMPFAAQEHCFYRAKAMLLQLRKHVLPKLNDANSWETTRYKHCPFWPFFAQNQEFFAPSA